MKIKATLMFAGLLTLASEPASAEVTRIRGTKVEYFDSGGAGPTILFIHGNSSSMSAYNHQFRCARLRGYRVMAFSLAGFGSSNASDDPTNDYGLRGHSKQIRRFMSKLDIGDATVIGWSAGGNAVLQAIHHLPHAAGFGIFGTAPLANTLDDFPIAFYPHPDSVYGSQEIITPAEADLFVATFFSPTFGTPPISYLVDAERTDGLTRTGLATSFINGDFRNQRDVVGNMTRPLLVMHGADDQLVQESYFATVTMPTLWQNAVQVVMGAGHAIQEEQPEEFCEIVGDFVDDITGS